jgi:hypothetical protein
MHSFVSHLISHSSRLHLKIHECQKLNYIGLVLGRFFQIHALILFLIYRFDINNYLRRTEFPGINYNAQYSSTDNAKYFIFYVFLSSVNFEIVPKSLFIEAPIVTPANLRIIVSLGTALNTTCFLQPHPINNPWQVISLMNKIPTL